MKLKNRLLYSHYLITGLNLDRLINTLKKEGIVLYDAKKLDRKRLKLTISSSDDKKFFAKLRNMCYNVKKLKNTGILAPFLYLYKNVGVFIGLVVFIASTICFNNVLIDIDFTGTGSLYKNQVSFYLEERGIKRFTPFSKIGLQELESDLLTNFDFSFVSAKKQGNRLIINSVLSTEPKNTIDTSKKRLISSVDGVVVNVNVYRGTAVVNVGDAVKKGDLLVDGYKIKKEEIIETYALACVTIKCEYNSVFESNLDEQEERAMLFAEQELGDKEIVNRVVNKIKQGDKFAYHVKLEYLTIVT